MKNFKFLFPFASNYFFDLKKMNIDKLGKTIKIIKKTKIVSMNPIFSPLKVKSAV